MTKDGKHICANKGCTKRSFKPEDADLTCSFHSGDAIFHDLKKYWSCCNKIAYDWDEFTALPTCQTGTHLMKYK